VGAVTADEPTVFMRDHWSELDADRAMGASDGQGGICERWHRVTESIHRYILPLAWAGRQLRPSCAANTDVPLFLAGREATIE